MCFSSTNTEFHLTFCHVRKKENFSVFSLSSSGQQGIQHWNLAQRAIHILHLSKSFSKERWKKEQTYLLLRKAIQIFKVLFGLRFCNMNVKLQVVFSFSCWVLRSTEGTAANLEIALLDKGNIPGQPRFILHTDFSTDAARKLALGFRLVNRKWLFRLQFPERSHPSSPIVLSAVIQDGVPAQNTCCSEGLSESLQITRHSWCRLQFSSHSSVSHPVGHSGNPHVPTFGIVGVFSPSSLLGFFQRLSLCLLEV